MIHARNKLTARHRFRELPRGSEYKAAFDAITKRYDGRDTPLTKDLKHPSVDLNIRNKSRAIVYCGDVDAHYGEGLLGPIDGKKPWISLEYQLHSQHPSVKLIIEDPEGRQPKVTCHIFPGCLSRGPSGHSYFILHSNSFAGQARSGNYQELREQKRIASYDNDAEIRKSVGEGARPARPSFTGIRLAEMLQIVDTGYRYGPVRLTLREELLFLLATQRNISIFRTWPEGGLQQLEIFSNWLKGAFMACSLYGYNWFYRCQSGADIDSVDFKHRVTERPRWLGSEFALIFGEEDAVIDILPYAVNSFASNAGKPWTLKGSNLLPNADVRAFGYITALDRNQPRQSAALRELYSSNAFRIKDFLSVGCNIKPEPTTRIRLFARDTGADESCYLFRFKGMVTDDLFNTYSEVNLLVNAPEVDLPSFDPRFDLDECPIAIEFIDDPTPTIRHKIAIQELRKGLSQRTQGVDLKHLILQSPQQYTNTGSHATEFLESLAAQVAAMEVSVQCHLNLAQTEIFNLANTTVTGNVCIHGLTGAGNKMLANGETKLRRCGLAAAPSSLAVANMVEIFCRDGPQGLEVVVYKGSFLPENRFYEHRFYESVEHDDLEDLEDNLHPLWQLAEEPTSTGEERYENMDFNIKRIAAFKRWAATLDDGVTAQASDTVSEDAPSRHVTHKMAEPAKAFLALREKVKKNASPYLKSWNQRKQYEVDRRNLNELDDQCSGYYLAEEVDMVFCINSISAQGLLRKYYKPTFILQDEATTISVPDAFTPVAAFIEHVELLVQAGDHQQDRPEVISQGSNEFWDLLHMSPFELTVVDGMYLRESRMLEYHED